MVRTCLKSTQAKNLVRAEMPGLGVSVGIEGEGGGGISALNDRTRRCVEFDLRFLPFRSKVGFRAPACGLRREIVHARDAILRARGRRCSAGHPPMNYPRVVH